MILALVIGSGGLTVAGALLIHPGPPPAAWRAGLVAGAFLASELALLHIRFGHNQYSVSCAEAAVVLGLVVVPTPWLLVLAPAGAGLGHLVRRRPPLKTAFNAGGVATGLLLARATSHLVAPAGLRGVLQPRSWAALALATLVYWVWSCTTVSAIVAYSQGLRMGSVYAASLRLNILVWLGNTVVGIGCVALSAWAPRTLFLLPFFLALLFLAYQGYLRAMQERDTWQVLQGASRELTRLRQEDVARVVLDRSVTLFKAEFVELMVTDGEPGTRATVYRQVPDGIQELRDDPLAIAAGFWPRAFSERELFEVVAPRAPAAQRAELEDLGLATCMVAPLVTAHECLGTLRIGFRGMVKMGTRELQVLSTFANQVSTAVHNARLFEEASEERAKLSRVVDNSSDGILSVDARWWVTSWSPAMVRITGVPEAAALGRTLFEGLGCVDPTGAPVTAAWLDAQVEGVDQTKSLVGMPWGGTTRWLDLSIATVLSPAGEPESAVIVARDVTALRKAEEAKRDFVATISHELRTPLTSLKGFLLTVVRSPSRTSDEELADYHDRMLRQTRRLERLIEDLLSASHLERGEFEVESTPTSMDECVEKVVQDFVVQNPSRPIKHRRAGLAGMALADAGRVEQVVANLISNADKYSPEGTPIVVSVERADDSVLVRVIDQGPGIPEDERDAVFERFHRLGHHLTRQPGGTGLGLYIARSLVEAMGGRIWVDSCAGAGATFQLSLPAARLVASSQEAS